jgi:hypothetical protein
MWSCHFESSGIELTSTQTSEARVQVFLVDHCQQLLNRKICPLVLRNSSYFVIEISCCEIDVFNFAVSGGGDPNVHLDPNLEYGFGRCRTKGHPIWLSRKHAQRLSWLRERARPLRVLYMV